MRYARKVVTIAIVGTIAYGTAMMLSHQISWFSDNFLYLPSVEAIHTGDGVVEVVTSSGSTYIIEEARR